MHARLLEHASLLWQPDTNDEIRLAHGQMLTTTTERMPLDRNKKAGLTPPEAKTAQRYQTLSIHSLFFLYSMSANRVLAMFSASHMAPAYPMTG